MNAQAEDLAAPPHVWGKDLRCKLCHLSTVKARQMQPETKGVGPCPVAQALQRLADR